MRGSRIFFRGGGGGGGQARRSENSLDNVFFFYYFFNFTFYRGGPMVLLQRKLYFSKDPEGVQHFPGGEGGSNFFPAGDQMVISIETHITCDFPGGPDPLSPL